MKYIQLNDISKSYDKGKFKAVEKVSFDVERGEIFGLIGADGAGKTTIFRILTTLLIPDSGKATVLDMDVVKNFKKIRKDVGYMPGKFSLYQDLTVEENLKFYATLFGTTIEQNFDLIEDIYLQIEPFKDRKAGNLSGGMKQKLALSCALIHKPRVLFLDEPTTGIDPVSRKELWNMLKKLKQHDISILASTPYMDEAMQCDRIGLIDAGKIMQIDTPNGIIHTFDQKIYSLHTENTYQTLKKLSHQKDILNTYPFGDNIHIITEKDKNLADNNELAEYNLNEIEPTIEDCFIELSRINK